MLGTALAKDASSAVTPVESLQKQSVTPSLINDDPGIQHEPLGLPADENTPEEPC